eukprot:scaffold145680_cov54-Cyclotella_meneghiniana.AAC.3
MSASSSSDRTLHSPDPAIELPRVLAALKAVYAPNLSLDATQPIDATFSRRDQADRYLTSFQRLPVAWVVCDQLLSNNSYSPADATSLQQSQFFAAQTLHSKCLSDVHQLPRESLGSLRDSLGGHFANFASDSKSRALVNRLGMALAALAIQLNWVTVFEDFLSLIHTRPELTGAVLVLFGSIPEEADSDRLVLVSGEDDLYHFKSILREKGADIVLSLCASAVESSCGYRQHLEKQQQNDGINASGYPNSITSTNDHQDVAIAEAVLSCFQSWIRIVDMPPTLLQNSMLLHWIFDYIMADSTNGGYEMAVDVVVEIMRNYTSERNENAGLIQVIVPRVMALGGIHSGGGNNIGLSPFEKAIREEDEDGMRGYCRIFTEMGESYLSLILGHEDLNQELLVELVLKCASIPDRVP